MSNNNQNKPGYKHTPLGWIPEQWEVKAIKDLSQDMIQGVNTAIDIPDYVPNGIPILKANNIIDGDVDLENADQISIKTFENYSDRFKVKIDDFLFSNIGARLGTGSLMKSKRDCSFAWNVMRIVPNTKVVLPEYLSFIINSPFLSQKIRRAQSGSGMGFVPKNILKNITFYIPQCLNEQKKIAAILSTWDEAIAKTQQLIAQLQQRNKGLMQQLLTGKKRLKGFKKCPNKLLPINLVAKEISEKNKEDKGLIVLSCTKYNGLVPSLEYFGRKIYSDDLTTYKIVSRKCFAYATNHIEEGSIGFQSEYEQALISPMYTVFKTDDSVNDEYLFKVLKSHHYIHEYQKRMEGSIDRRGGLRWNEFSKIKVLIPLIDEQKAIAGILNKADDEVKLNQQKLSTLQQQKKGLMQKLLTGEVRVKI